MNEYGVSTSWHEYERAGQAYAIWREKHTPSLYRAECKWWSAHLAYGNRLPGADAGTWLDTVEAWSLCVNRLGCAEALDEVDRLRKEAGR